MHEVARRALRERFARVAHCAGRPGADRAYFLKQADMVLDEFLSYDLLATEWDADQWGLNPDDWMTEERAEMRRRGGDRRPTEAADA